MDNLLDTHTLIWFLEGDFHISPAARKSIEKENVINFVSAVSLWEIAIKISLNKLSLNGRFEDFILKLSENGFQILPINSIDTLLVSRLDFKHRDPFDRMIVAQAINNNLNLISKDKILSEYPLQLIW
ncbi:MAG: type II toxin-antitoxin system VapC family toxin [Moheibacter sp.]